MSKKVVLITGASSGIGFESALELNEKGFIVYGAARRTEKLKELESKGIKTIHLDVTNDESMVKCVDQIVNNEGRIDVLVNNAGYGSYGAIEDVPMIEARRQVEVNVFGLARMTQLVLPYMRKQHFGRIINVTSIGGKMHTIFGGWYHTSKFAIEGFSDCLRVEVEEFGIDVVVIEPGGIKTDWGMIAAENLKKTSLKGAYAKSALKSANKFIQIYSGNRLTDPKVIAQTITRAATTIKPKTRYIIGFGAKPMVFLKRVLSDRMFDKIIKSVSR
jgi:NAD(P)-dependent dehydrogenase (short-subunit alcohol dehydrogenase family)